MCPFCGVDYVFFCVYILGNTALHLACMLGHKGLSFIIVSVCSTSVFCFDTLFDTIMIFTVQLHVMQCMVLLSQFCPSLCLSVHLSVRCVCCDKTKWCTADILIVPYERAITLVFWHQQWLVGDALFHVKYSLKVTHLLCKTPTSWHTLMFCAGQAWRIPIQVVVLARPIGPCWWIAMASLVPGWPCAEPLAVPTTAQWTFQT